MSSQESNVDRLLKARAEIDEELRRHKLALTILFTDVVGSTAYFDRYGDTAGMAMLHRQAELTAATVSEFRGTVVKRIGDSVMAEFPEPAFGVRAGVELQRRLLLLNQKLPERERVQLRVGINHGPAFRHGSDVYGDAVNLAARITKRSGPAQVLIARSVRDAIVLDPELRCTWLGKVTIEGKTEKEDVFEVVWTDTATYADLRANVTAAFARGELMSPGARLEDFLQPGPAPTPIPSEETTAELPPTPAPVPLTARYDILGELGSGGMGIVYKARDRITGELVALKVLKPEIATDQKVMERFKNELRLARKITHKNVCRIHELNLTDSTAYISMEFVDGESLRKVLNRFESLSLRKGLKIAQQICSGLREAHAQGIVHRDLKPENVMLDRAGQAKVMDFGIARSVETGATQTGAVIGTPAYMSPEQAEGKPADARSDLYSLGLILYEMFTGQQAFSGDTPVAVALKQIRETPPPPSELEPSIPSHIEKAILRCLEKNPGKRFASVDELEAALTAKPARESGEVRAPAAVAAEVEEPGLVQRALRGWGLTPRRWWELDTLAGLLVFYPLMIYFGWKVKEWTQEPGFFFGAVAYVVAPFSLRVFLLATAAFNPAVLPREVRRLAPWLMFAHLLLFVGVLTGAIVMWASHTGFAALLVGFVVAGLVAVLIIHPAINRAAFPEIGAKETPAPGLAECRRMGWIQAIYLVPFGFFMLVVPISIGQAIARADPQPFGLFMAIVPEFIAEAIGKADKAVLGGMIGFWAVVLAFGILMGRSMLALREGNRQSVGVFYRWFPLFFLADLLAVALMVGLLAGMRMLALGLLVLPVLLYLPFYQRGLARKLLESAGNRK